MMSEFGSANRLPLVPAQSKTAAMLAAMPRQYVSRRRSEIASCRKRRGRTSHCRLENDVDVNVLLGILHLQEKQLRDNEVRDVIVNRRPNENDSVLSKRE